MISFHLPRKIPGIEDKKSASCCLHGNRAKPLDTDRKRTKMKERKKRKKDF